MSDNKFIQRLKGQQTPKSVVEVQNDKLIAPFTGVPYSTDVVGDIIDDKDSSIVVAKGAQNWKLDGNSLVATSSLSGDGADYTGEFNASGSGLWINAVYSLPATIFTAGTKWVLKLCGKNLLTTSGETIGFTLVVKVGNTHITSKTFFVYEGANVFCRQMVIDFSESEQSIIKAQSGDKLTLQLLCSDTNASATIYNGMTVLTALQRRVDGDAVASDTKTFEELEAISDAHISNKNNPHEVTKAQVGLGNCDNTSDLDKPISTATQTALNGKVNIDGTSVMTAPLKFRAGSMRGAVGPYLNGVSFWKMDSQGNITNIANLTDSQFLPVTTNAIDLGRSANAWKNLYLAGKAYVATINNGADLSVPNKSGTLATTADVELAARSGRMLTDQGVWYAKMYAATVAPSAENGTNYADFSQTDGQGNPIIVTYNRVNGAWVQDQTITPPAEYDGYVIVTSKIWDIAEQTGQQGGRVLWNHTSKEFTPYPTIVSFENAALTGTPTAPLPDADSPDNQIATKEYVDTHVPENPSTFHPDLFDWKWADHQVNDVQWLRADTYSWQDGTVYEAAFKELHDDIYQYTTWYVAGQPLVRTYSPTPAVGDTVYYDPYPTTEAGTVTAYDDVNNTITVSNGYTYAYNSGAYATPVTETVAGITVTYYPGTSGRKIVPMAYMSAVESVYTATGVAWYYIIDIPGKRFKLPRTKFGVTGLRDTVGNYVYPTLPNIKGTFNAYEVGRAGQVTTSGALYATNGGNQGTSGGTGDNACINLDASLFDSTYVDDATVQQAATQMYLYFYVGEFTQTALENTAGITAETLNDKVDKGHQVVEFQEPTSANNYTWYRKYADGWVEQGGTCTPEYAGTAVSFPTTMANTNYQFQLSVGQGQLTGTVGAVVDNRTTTGMTVYSNWSATQPSYICWEIKGMSA